MKHQQGQGDLEEEEEDPERQHCNLEDLLLGSDKWHWLVKGDHRGMAVLLELLGLAETIKRKVPCLKGILSDNQHFEFHQLTVA